MIQFKIIDSGQGMSEKELYGLKNEILWHHF